MSDCNCTDYEDHIAGGCAARERANKLNDADREQAEKHQPAPEYVCRCSSLEDHSLLRLCRL